jgi:hypothetical protein
MPHTLGTQDLIADDDSFLADTLCVILNAGL